MTFVKLLMAQINIHTQKSRPAATGAAESEAEVMRDGGGMFTSEAELFQILTACIPLREVQHINSTPYPFRRELLAWTQAIFWTIFPQHEPLERNSLPHSRKMKQYTQCLCLFLNGGVMIRDILSLRLSSRLCLKFRQFPVPHAPNTIIELQLIEGFLGFEVAAGISTGILTAALRKIAEL